MSIDALCCDRSERHGLRPGKQTWFLPIRRTTSFLSDRCEYQLRKSHIQGDVSCYMPPILAIADHINISGAYAKLWGDFLCRKSVGPALPYNLNVAGCEFGHAVPDTSIVLAVAKPVIKVLRSGGPAEIALTVVGFIVIPMRDLMFHGWFGSMKRRADKDMHEVIRAATEVQRSVSPRMSVRLQNAIVGSNSSAARRLVSRMPLYRTPFFVYWLISHLALLWRCGHGLVMGLRPVISPTFYMHFRDLPRREFVF